MIIYRKINNIMKKVSFVKKDGKIGFGNNVFSVVTYDRLLSVIRSHLIDEEVIIVPTQIDRGIYTEGLTKNGGKKFRYDALYDIKFIAIEDGSEIISRHEVSAEGHDDKQPSKAVTIATKNAILKVFSLETGDDEHEESVNTIDSKQVGMLSQLIADTQTDIEKFLKAYNITKASELQSGYFAQALNQLQSKAKKQKEVNKDATQNTTN